VKELVGRDAEVYCSPPHGYPAVTIAGWNKHTSIVYYFLESIPAKAAGTNGLGVSMVLAARFGWTSVAKEHIVRDRLAIHQRGPVGETTLHWTAHNGHTEIVGLLLDAGAYIEADEIGLYGGKPLHWAAEHEPITVRLLLGRGTDVNARNIKAGEFCGFTPLIMNAAQNDDSQEVTEILLSAGADIHHDVAQAYLSRIHCRHVALVWGNHDHKSIGVLFTEAIQQGMIKIPDRHIWLNHYPMRSWNKRNHGSWHLSGHVHNRLTEEDEAMP
jgi:hypothetical protein